MVICPVNTVPIPVNNPINEGKELSKLPKRFKNIHPPNRIEEEEILSEKYLTKLLIIL